MDLEIERMFDEVLGESNKNNNNIPLWISLLYIPPIVIAIGLIVMLL